MSKISMRMVGVLLFLQVTGCTGTPEESAEMQRVVAAYEAGNYPESLRLAQQVTARTGENKEIAFYKGISYLALRQYAQAEQALENAVAEEPAPGDSWLQLGHVYFRQRQYRDALHAYKQEQERSDPDDAALWAQVGRTYALLNNADSASIAYQQAIQADSTLAVARGWYSELLEQQGRYEEALLEAQYALNYHPQNNEYGYRVGLLYLLTDQAEAAIPFLGTAATRWPAHEGATYNLGLALKKVGQEEEGQAYLDRMESIQALQEEAMQAERSVEMDPTNPERWATLGSFMMNMGYLDRAEAAFLNASNLEPGNVTLKSDLANLAFARGDTLLALERYRSALEQDPTFADGWLNMGVVYAMIGDREEARNAWNQVLQFKPDDPDARAYLDQLSQFP